MQAHPALTSEIWPRQIANRIEQGKSVVVLVPVTERDPLDPGLSEEERCRAQGFGHEAGRNAFVTGRILLRRVLSEFVPEPRVETGPHGKPYCVRTEAPEFNLSHAAGGIAAVFSRKGPVGVDLEGTERAPKSISRLAERVFSPEERKLVTRNPDLFLALWTRKEAVLKTMGTGFSAGASDLDAESVARENAWSLCSFRRDRWTGAVCAPVASSPVLVLDGNSTDFPLSDDPSLIEYRA